MTTFIQFVIEVGSIFASNGERKIEIDTYQRTLNHIYKLIGVGDHNEKMENFLFHINLYRSEERRVGKECA